MEQFPVPHLRPRTLLRVPVMALALWWPGWGQDLLSDGQKALREGRVEEAYAAFQSRLVQMPQDVDARVSAGFAALRLDRLREAEVHFREAIQRAPRYADAHFGLGLALERQGHDEEAKAALKAAKGLDPARTEFAEAYDRVLARHPDPLPPVQRPAALQLGFRVTREGFQVRRGSGWRPLFLKGVNLGAALPGKYPSEFPDRATYDGWLKDMAELGVNSLRVYTIHPPAFYEALRAHNLRARTPIYLIHGVWIEPPPDDDFREPGWLGAWKTEMARVVDLLHGHANLPQRPGHASGMYRADVSPWVIAYILGREWEPFNVVGFNERNPGLADFRGRFLEVRQGHATEVFMGEALEALLAYEHDTYHAQRPSAFTNWPTLDPLHHPTEATKEEELALRRKLGLPLEQGQEVREYDNDAVGLDMEKYQATALYQGGLFASYHAYPYYPDFMNLDPGYNTATDHLGRNNYMGYLRALVRHHRTHAVVISEFGVPSSRLVAHWQPQGLTHGGQTEVEKGQQDARMFRNIHDAGCAGGVLFAWIDEWFKKNWLVIDFEEPLERKPYWYNVQDAEENYGLIGYRPGNGGPRIRIDGKAGDWSQVPVYLENPELRLKVLADEGWLYLGLFAPSLPFDWSREGFLVGIDTVGTAQGDHRLPFGLPLSSEAGLEFALRLQGDRTAVLADDAYDLFTHRYSRPYRSVENADGRFVMPRTESNRARIGRDGTFFPEHRQEIGWLRKGIADPSSPAYDSRAEWMEGPGFVEVRIPWGLLNVTDPSQRRVVEDPVPHTDIVGTRITEGFRLVLARFTGAEAPLKPQTVLPEPRQGRIPLPPLFTWPTWDQPTYHAYRKPTFDILRKALAALPDEPLPPTP